MDVGYEASNNTIAGETGIDLSKVPNLTKGLVDKGIINKRVNPVTRKNHYKIGEQFFSLTLQWIY